jgi:hypothetical protein
MPTKTPSVDHVTEVEDQAKKDKTEDPKVNETAPPNRVRWPGPGALNAWDEGRNVLIQFLKDLRAMMIFLLVDRIPDDERVLFSAVSTTVTTTIDDVIKILEKTDDDDENHKKLTDAGLTGNGLSLKTREFARSVAQRPATESLAAGDIILNSLVTCFPLLEPVKEYKEVLEHRLRTGSDKGVQSVVQSWRNWEF